jgi:hypothetical protein
MPIFTDRRSASGSAVRGGDALRAPPPGSGVHLWIAGTDYGSSVIDGTLRLRLPAANANGDLQCQIEDYAGTGGPPANAEVLVVDYGLSGRELLWGGFLVARRRIQLYGAVARYELRAADYGLLLDRSVVDYAVFAAGSTDRDVIQALVASYAKPPLRAPASFVSLTATGLPALTISGQSLRQAIEQVAKLAGGGRTYYVDALARLHYGYNELEPAPYEIADLPTSSAQAPAESIEVEYDDSQLTNAVWVVGTGASGWVTDAASIAQYGRREAVVEVKEATTSDLVTAYGQAYLADHAQPIIRGSATVAEPYFGWLPGQTVLVTSAAHGLNRTAFVVQEVSAEAPIPGGGPKGWRWTIAFGAPPKSLVRLLAAGAS